MPQDDAIIAAISDLSQRMENRFDKVEERFDRLDGRVRKTEVEITKIKTFGSLGFAALTFVGWEHVKSWVIALIR